MVYRNTLLISYQINSIRKISDQEKSDNCTWKFLQIIKVDLIDTVSRCLKLNYVYFLSTSDDMNFRIDRRQRLIVLENLNWLYAARDKTWSNFKSFQYLHWMKETLDTRLSQIWTGLQTIKSILIHEYQHGSTGVNTNQHESDTSQHELARVQHKSQRINTSLKQV